MIKPLITLIIKGSLVVLFGILSFNSQIQEKASNPEEVRGLLYYLHDTINLLIISVYTLFVYRLMKVDELSKQ